MNRKRRFTILLLSLLAPAIGTVCNSLSAVHAQDGPPADFSIIEEQPAGHLVTYTRSGGLIREVEKAQVDEDDPYEIIEGEQDGSINIVFAADNKVYIQQPTSWIPLYDGWVEGTLSDDGKTITVQLGQYTAYTRAFNLGTQLWLFNYDEAADTYVRDEQTTQIVYSIDDEGVIRLQGTSRQPNTTKPSEAES